MTFSFNTQLPGNDHKLYQTPAYGYESDGVFMEEKKVFKPKVGAKTNPTSVIESSSDGSYSEDQNISAALKYKIWSNKVNDEHVTDVLRERYIEEIRNARNRKSIILVKKWPDPSPRSSIYTSPVKPGSMFGRHSISRLRTSLVRPKITQNNKITGKKVDYLAKKTIIDFNTGKQKEVWLHSEYYNGDDEYYSWDPEIDTRDPISYRPIRRKRSRLKRDNSFNVRLRFSSIDKNKRDNIRSFSSTGQRRLNSVCSSYNLGNGDALRNEIGDYIRRGRNTKLHDDQDFYLFDEKTPKGKGKKYFKRRRKQRSHPDNDYYSADENTPKDENGKVMRVRRKHKLHNDNEYYSADENTPVDVNGKAIRQRRSHKLHFDTDYYSVDETTKKGKNGKYIRKKRRRLLHGDNEYYSADEKTKRNRKGKLIRKKRSHKLHGDDEYYSVDDKTPMDDNGHYIRTKRSHKLHNDTEYYSADESAPRDIHGKLIRERRRHKLHGDLDYYSVDENTKKDKNGRYIRRRRKHMERIDYLASDGSAVSGKSKLVKREVKRRKLHNGNDYYNVNEGTQKDSKGNNYIRGNGNIKMHDNNLYRSARESVHGNNVGKLAKNDKNRLLHGDNECNFIGGNAHRDERGNKIGEKETDKLKHDDCYFIDGNTPRDEKENKTEDKRTHKLKDDDEYYSIDENTPKDPQGKYIRKKRTHKLKHDDEYYSIDENTPKDPQGKYIRKKREHKLKQTDKLKHDDEYYSIDENTPKDSQGNYIRKKRTSKLLANRHAAEEVSVNDYNSLSEVGSVLKSPNKANQDKIGSVECDSESGSIAKFNTRQVNQGHSRTKTHLPDEPLQGPSNMDNDNKNSGGKEKQSHENIEESNITVNNKKLKGLEQDIILQFEKYEKEKDALIKLRQEKQIELDILKSKSRDDFEEHQILSIENVISKVDKKLVYLESKVSHLDAKLKKLRERYPDAFMSEKFDSGEENTELELKNEHRQRKTDSSHKAAKNAPCSIQSNPNLTINLARNPGSNMPPAKSHCNPSSLTIEPRNLGRLHLSQSQSTMGVAQESQQMAKLDFSALENVTAFEPETDSLVKNTGYKKRRMKRLPIARLTTASPTIFKKSQSKKR